MNRLVRAHSDHHLRRFVLLLIGGNLGVVAVLVCAAALALLASRHSHEVRARETTENLTSGLATEVSFELKQIDNALATIALQFEHNDPTLGKSAVIIEKNLAEQKGLLPQVDAIRIADAQGIVRWGLTPGGPTINLSDRDYFKAARTKQGMVISEPLQGRIIRKWGVILARRLQHADGSFAGVVYTNLSSEHFVERFKRLSVGDSGAISLRSASLQLIARYTAHDPPLRGIGTSNVSAELHRTLAKNLDRGFFVTRTTLDGVERTSAYQRVPGYPLIVLAGLGTAEFLAPWWREVWQLASLVGLVVIVIVGFSVIVVVQQRRQQRSQQEIAKLALEQSAMLDNEMIGMARVKERKMVWKNRALDLIFGYEAHELVGAPSRIFYRDDASYEHIGRAAYEVLARGERFRTQLQMRRKDGTAMWVDLSGAQVSEEESLWLMADISALKDSEVRAQHMALHDSLTGLPNRLLFGERLQYVLLNAQRTGLMTGVCFLDLDGFKAVNDRFGHEAGDALLREVSARLLASVRTNDVVARFGGDEFAIVLSNLQTPDEARFVMERILAAFQLPVVLPSGAHATVGCSIGIALSSSHGNDPALLMRLADEAMYTAKGAGKNRLHMCEPDSQAPFVASSGASMRTGLTKW